MTEPSADHNPTLTPARDNAAAICATEKASPP